MAVVTIDELERLEEKIKQKVLWVIEIERRKSFKGLILKRRPTCSEGILETRFNQCNEFEWEYDDMIFVGKILNPTTFIIKRYQRDYYEEVRI